VKNAYCFLTFVMLTVVSCTSTPPFEQPPSQDAPPFSVSTENIIRTIYAGERADFVFAIRFSTNRKDTVQLSVLNPTPNLEVKLNHGQITKSGKLRLVAQSYANTPEAKYKFLLEAKNARRRMIYPFIVNVLSKETQAPRVVIDFIPKELDSKNKADVIVGKIDPPDKCGIQASFSSLAGKKTPKHAATDAEGNFRMPAADLARGFYHVDILLKNCGSDKPNQARLDGQILLGNPSQLVEMALETNNPRLLKEGDHLRLTVALLPSPGRVPVKVKILRPAQESDSTIVVTDSTGVAKYDFLIRERGIHRIIARYDSRQTETHFTPVRSHAPRRLGRHDADTPVLLASQNYSPSISTSRHAAIASYSPIRMPSPRSGPISGSSVECVVESLVGLNTRAGLVVFIVGGSTVTSGGNPYYSLQTEIVNHLFLKMINSASPAWRQFTKDDIIYFNPLPQDVDGGGQDNENVAFNGSAIRTKAQEQIDLKTTPDNLVNNVPLYVIMLGQGGGTLPTNPCFRLSATASSSDSMNASLINVFLNNLVSNGHGKINRVFLFLDCDYAGYLAANISSPLPPNPPYCNFAVVTSTNETTLAYPGGYQDSFAWKFFDQALTPIITLNSGMTEANYIQQNNLMIHFNQAYCDIQPGANPCQAFVANGLQITPTWRGSSSNAAPALSTPTCPPLSLPPGVCNIFHPIGYKYKCVQHDLSMNSSASE